MTADASAARGLWTPLTFPRARAALAHRPVLLWWGFWLLVLNLGWAFLRSRADNLGAPVHGAEVERALFGSLPTLWLQENVYRLAPGLFEWASAAVHGSSFVVPPLAAVLVTWKRPHRLGSLFRWWATLQAIALSLFAIAPVAPPWLDDRHVVRLVAVAAGQIGDPNPFSALPAFYVALPLMISLWFFRERWTAPGTGMLAYSGLLAVEAVFSGEHYVVDVIGAAAVASLVAAMARLDFAPLTSRLSSLNLGRRAPEVSRPRPALEPNRTARSERGQALIEFAFVLPIILVFLLGLVDFGIALDRREVIQHAVREGTRAGAVDSDIVATTVDQSQDILTAANVAVCYVDGDDANSYPGNAGDSVRVSVVDYTYDFSIGSELLSAFGVGPLSIPMNPSAEARLETSVPGAADCTP